MQTLGISPKVLLPLVAGILIGSVLLIVGVAAHDNDVKLIGLSVLGAAAAHAGIGYSAPSGPVTVEATAQDSAPVVASTQP